MAKHSKTLVFFILFITEAYLLASVKRLVLLSATGEHSHGMFVNCWFLQSKVPMSSWWPLGGTDDGHPPWFSIPGPSTAASSPCLPPQLSCGSEVQATTFGPVALCSVKHQGLLMVDKMVTTAEIRPYENPRALQGRTVFNRYLGNG